MCVLWPQSACWEIRAFLFSSDGPLSFWRTPVRQDGHRHLKPARQWTFLHGVANWHRYKKAELVHARHNCPCWSWNQCRRRSFLESTVNIMQRFTLAACSSSNNVHAVYRRLWVSPWGRSILSDESVCFSHYQYKSSSSLSSVWRSAGA